MIYDGINLRKDYEYTGGGTELFYGVHFPSLDQGYVVGSSGLVRSRSEPTSLDEEEAGSFQAHFAPNPVQDKLRLNYEVQDGGKRQIELYDLQGDQVRSYGAQRIDAGSFRESFEVSSLSEGVYFLHLKLDDEKKVMKVMKSK